MWNTWQILHHIIFFDYVFIQKWLDLVNQGEPIYLQKDDFNLKFGMNIS